MGGWPLEPGRCTLGDVSTVTILAALQGPELLVILAILLVLFGGAKLPQLARSVGSAQREFRKGLSGDDDDKKSGTSEGSGTVAKGSETSGSDS